eukprot:TRINITY_DN1815_c0_g1_i66.p6 TRINITY_DN1815_c0_g1~~TRINITY_DN1815_c0_g1_i66.p6  ORF type:complete len:105 (-),score=6.70 TRINITY_DN1815_c0_g1_i66:155-469(-)
MYQMLKLTNVPNVQTLDGFHMNEFGFCIPGVLNKRPNIKCQPGKYNCAGFHMNEFGFCIPGTLMGTPNIKCQPPALLWEDQTLSVNTKCLNGFHMNEFREIQLC